MSNVKIKFHIDNLDKECFEDAWDIEGGLSIEKDDLVLTKRIDDEKDDGFRGDYVFFNILHWLSSVPELLSGQRCKIDLLEEPVAFLFLPIDKMIYFKYFIEGIGSLTENENKRYPNYEDGTPIATEDLISEIINVSENFIKTVEKKVQKKSDIIEFQKELLHAKKVYQEQFESANEFAI